VGLILVGLSLYPAAYAYLPAASYLGSTVTVQPFSSRKVEIGFVPNGGIFVVEVTVESGNGPAQIYVTLMDSSEGRLLPSVLVTESYRFVFRSPYDDSYLLFLDNTTPPEYAYTTDDPARYSKTVFCQIRHYGNYDLIFLLSGGAIFNIGIILVGLYQFKLKPRTQNETERQRGGIDRWKRRAGKRPSDHTG